MIGEQGAKIFVYTVTNVQYTISHNPQCLLLFFLSSLLL